MAIPQNKSELLFAINHNYSKLREDLVTVPVDWVELKELDGHAKGTTMSVKNLVAYLVGWGNLVLKWHHLMSNNKEVDFPETGYQWNELGQLAQKFYVDYEKEQFDELVKKLDDTVQKTIQLIEKQDNELLYKEGWYKKYSLGRMIQLNTSAPFKNARTRVRKFKRLKK